MYAVALDLARFFALKLPAGVSLMISAIVTGALVAGEGFPVRHRWKAVLDSSILL
jgi:hypothetical protein